MQFYNHALFKLIVCLDEKNILSVNKMTMILDIIT